MGAPEGNKFYLNRSKHGRDKLFKTPKLLWEAAVEYFTWCDENPLKESKLVTYEGQSIIEELPLRRPYTLEGLCLYLGANTAYFRQFKKALRIKVEKEQIDKDFSTVIRTIEDTIRAQKFEGAAVGHFNANIIARDLGLKDKADITTDDKVLPAQVPEIKVYNSAPPLASSEDDVEDAKKEEE
jgi:hypothetical protein